MVFANDFANSLYDNDICGQNSQYRGQNLKMIDLYYFCVTSSENKL